MRMAQNVVDKTKEVGVLGHLYDTAEDKIADIGKDINSKFEKEKIDGLKRLVALISKGRNVAEFFPDVVKNVASPSFEVRKLVYIYILRYAEQQPDLALLAINTFQKDLADPNPFIRAMSLRVMSSIRVPVIVPIIMVALRKGITDLSPYVRKTAANALTKCFSLDPSQKETLIQLIESMLNDNSTAVLGSVLASLSEICPERLDLIHKHYRKLCRTLPDADEWTQIQVMDTLLNYARTQFLNPDVGASEVVKVENGTLEAKKDIFVEKKPLKMDLNSFYSDDDEEFVPIKTEQKSVPQKIVTGQLDADLSLLLQSSSSLLTSRNSMVILSVARLHVLLAPKYEHYKVIKPLIRILRTSREERYVILANIVTMCEANQALFAPYTHEFIVFAGEPKFIRELKIQVLVLIASSENLTLILRELKDYTKMPDSDWNICAIKAIGRLSLKMHSCARQFLDILMDLISHHDENVSAEAIIVIRRLLHQLNSTTSSEPTIRIVIKKLAKKLDSISSPKARSSVLWLVATHCGQIPKIAPDVVRDIAKSYASEAEMVKVQAISLAAKLALYMVEQNEILKSTPPEAQQQQTAEVAPKQKTTTKKHGKTKSKKKEKKEEPPFQEVVNIVMMLFQYILQMSRFDSSFDVRDRARIYKLMVYDILTRRLASGIVISTVNANDSVVEAEKTVDLERSLQTPAEAVTDHPFGESESPWNDGPKLDETAIVSGTEPNMTNSSSMVNNPVRKGEYVDSVFPSISKELSKILSAPHPIPKAEHPFASRKSYTIGSLSHLISHRAENYTELPEWPTVQPDPTTRQVADAESWSRDRTIASTPTSLKQKKNMKKRFISLEGHQISSEEVVSKKTEEEDLIEIESEESEERGFYSDSSEEEESEEEETEDEEEEEETEESEEETEDESKERE
ncbi:AP-3 complex subunit beta-2 [Nowakowskiella sp. JEL0407]|nr:AP-3 complex subunit beta-2 [Nowakowskiella sp. JEL0407]